MNLTSARGWLLLLSSQPGIFRTVEVMELRRTIRYAARHSPFYQARFAESGVSPKLVRSRDDLHRLGWFTHSADLEADSTRFLAVPKRRVIHLMSSTGTTGVPKRTLYSKRDWNSQVQVVHWANVVDGLGPNDVGQVLYNTGTPAWATGAIIAAGLARTGLLVVPTGNEISTREQLAYMQMFGTTVLFSTPSYLHRLTVEGSEILDLLSLGIRIIKVGSEPSLLEQRLEWGRAWGAAVYDGYGMMELGGPVAGECRARTGLHVNPFMFIEIVDRNTGDPVAEGQTGEIVVTTLRRQAMPLIRYRTGDLARHLRFERCSCGVGGWKIDYVEGRADDLIQIGTGENLHPTQIKAALRELPGVRNYQVVISKDGFKDRLLVRLEAKDASDFLVETAKQRLCDEIPFIRHDVERSKMITEPEVEFVPEGTLFAEQPIKHRFLVDKRRSQDLTHSE